MKQIKITNIQNRVDFLSVDKTKAISAHGELFTVGDLVEHEDSKVGTNITSFELDVEDNSVKAITPLGWSHICFITKVKQVDI